MRSYCAATAGLLALLVVGLAGCGGPPVYLASAQPAEVQLPASVRTVAVIPFSCPGAGGAEQASMAGGLLAARLNGSGRFNVVERGNLRDILKEQDLADAGLTDPATAARAGKLLNADAVIFGNLLIQVNDSYEVKQVPTYASSGPKYKTVRKLRRTGTASMTFKLVNPETAQLIISKQCTHDYDSDKVARGFSAMFSDDTGSHALPPAEVARGLVQLCVDDFYKLISPHVDVFEVQLAKGDSDLAKSGLAMAKAGDYAEAAKLFEEAIQLKPEDHGSIYNLGVMRLVAGDVAGANERITQAIRLKDDKKYIAARTEIASATRGGNATVRAATPQEVQEYQQVAGLKKRKSSSLF